LSRARDLLEEMFDISYYLEEGCGMFVLAYNKLYPGHNVAVFSNSDGEKWSRSFNYEITHVAVALGDGKYVDIKGVRSKSDISSDFNTDKVYPVSIDDFKRRFIGNTDNKPLYKGSKGDIEDLYLYIKRNPEKYRS